MGFFVCFCLDTQLLLPFVTRKIKPKRKMRSQRLEHLLNIVTVISILKLEFRENTVPLKLNKLCIAFRERMKEI